jgi:hypothetical protein
MSSSDICSSGTRSASERQDGVDVAGLHVLPFAHTTSRRATPLSSATLPGHG